MDSELDMPCWRAVISLLTDCLPATRRSERFASTLWFHGMRCGAYGAAGVAIALLAWYPGRWLTVLILLPLIWSTTGSRWSALSLWAAYYLTGARDIPLVCERFFVGHGELSANAALSFGIVFWLGQAVVLAAPWALLTPRAGEAPHAIRAVLATLFVSLPPLGIIGWLSPLHVASALYPGWQLAGLLLGACMLAAAACVRHSQAAWISVGLLTGAAVVAHLVTQRHEIPVGWVAVDTSLGRLDQRDYEALDARLKATKQAAQVRFETGASVVVLSEEIVGLWRPAMQYWWQDYIQQLAASNKTLIFGADLVEAGSLPGKPISDEPRLRYTDSAVVVGAGRGRFDSRQPVPVGLWRPWANVSASRGNMTQPYLAIAGRRAAFSICYEDFLWWPHWRLLVDRPDVLISMSNGWFDSDLGLARIQQQSTDSIARLANVPLLRAVNR
ncbi:carbon-nitrogen hydrolase family protein [Paraburkholderia azotifigens]|uniref:conjugal transfer protein TraB n=1 Tax=Paraburkholderia azotifigens TaxID=2057004 RepID=UPI0038BDBDDE